MRRNTVLSFVLCVCVAGSLHCKKSGMEGHFIIVTQDNVKIRSGASISPDTKFETAAKFSRFDLYGTKENMGLTYFLVRHNNRDAYINKGDYGFDVMEPVEKGSKGLVTKASLAARKAPDDNQTVPTLFSLRKGDVIDVIARGARTWVRDGVLSPWYLVKAPDGNEGYVFGGSLITGSEQTISALKDAKFEACAGWVLVTGEARFTSIPGENAPAVTKNDPAPCDHTLDKYPGKGGYAPVAQKFIIGAETYYCVKDSYMSFLECRGSINAWIAAKHVEYIPDFYEHSKAKAGSKFSPALLDLVNREIGGNLNVITMKMEPLNLMKKPGTSHYLVKAMKGHRNPEHVLIIEKKGEAFQPLLKIMGGGWEIDPEWQPQPEFKDIDGDGTGEIFVSHPATDGYYRFAVYGMSGSAYSPAITVDIFGVNACFRRDPFLIFVRDKIEARDKKESLSFLKKEPFSSGFADSNIRVLKFGRGKYAEVEANSAGIDIQQIQESGSFSGH